jgi:hypothetical protein
MLGKQCHTSSLARIRHQACRQLPRMPRNHASVQALSTRHAYGTRNRTELATQLRWASHTCADISRALPALPCSAPRAHVQRLGGRAGGAPFLISLSW